MELLWYCTALSNSGFGQQAIANGWVVVRLRFHWIDAWILGNGVELGKVVVGWDAKNVVLVETCC